MISELPLGFEKWIQVSKCFQGIVFYHFDQFNWSHMSIFANKKRGREDLVERQEQKYLLYGLTLSCITYFRNVEMEISLVLLDYEKNMSIEINIIKEVSSLLRHYLTEALQLIYALMAKIFDTGTFFVCMSFPNSLWVRDFYS